ncbi:MAG: hypothetical protein AVDCRST_MAG39-2656, partial [uncultured Sphingomonadaceae bacterium]
AGAHVAVFLPRNGIQQRPSANGSCHPRLSPRWPGHARHRCCCAI